MRGLRPQPPRLRSGLLVARRQFGNRAENIVMVDATTPTIKSIQHAIHPLTPPIHPTPLPPTHLPTGRPAGEAPPYFATTRTHSTNSTPYNSTPSLTTTTTHKTPRINATHDSAHHHHPALKHYHNIYIYHLCLHLSRGLACHHVSLASLACAPSAEGLLLFG